MNEVTMNPMNMNEDLPQTEWIDRADSATKAQLLEQIERLKSMSFQMGREIQVLEAMANNL